jgi:hypothetical protein
MYAADVHFAGKLKLKLSARKVGIREWATKLVEAAKGRIPSHSHSNTRGKG